MDGFENLVFPHIRYMSGPIAKKANLKLLNEYYDNSFSDLISEDRNKKLEAIGI